MTLTRNDLKGPRGVNYTVECRPWVDPTYCWVVLADGREVSRHCTRRTAWLVAKGWANR